MERMVLTAQEVADALGVKQSKAYSIIKELNGELKAKGFLTVNGKISRVYFMERVYGAGKEQGENGQ